MIDISSHRKQLGEIVRFGIVGAVATLLQYAIYWLLIRWLSPTVAMAIGYAISFAFNFVASTRYTFRVDASARRGAGFAFSHAVNFVLQMLVLNLAGADVLRLCAGELHTRQVLLEKIKKQQ